MPIERRRSIAPSGSAVWQFTGVASSVSCAALLLRLSLAVAMVTLSNGCQERLDVGRWRCTAEYGDSGTAADQFPLVSAAIDVPWSTGFEDGFCGFRDAGGFCYANPAAAYELVREPVRSGQFAAAFHVAGGVDSGGLQSRCVRQGRLPTQAYYGAWFLISGPVSEADNWNLFHFEGPVTTQQNGQWDVSLRASEEGLELYVFDFLRMRLRALEVPSSVPIGEWFHLQVSLTRATDTTGQFGLYLDGARVLELNDIDTVNTETTQWYVGSLAEALVPNDTILYVDDVSITPTLTAP